MTVSRVIIESPFKGDIEQNRMYARLAMHISLVEHKESPLAFHTIYTQSLDDSKPKQRALGIERSFPWYEVADKVVYMVDRGFSSGMQLGYVEARRQGKEVTFRTASTNPDVIKEVASWVSIEDALAGFEKIKSNLGCKGEMTNYLDERCREIEMIRSINSSEFRSEVEEELKI